MNNTTKIILAAVIGLIVGAGGGYASTEKNTVAENSNAQHAMSDGQMMQGGSMSMGDEMTSMNAVLQGRTGDAFDQAFLTEMTLHHQGAVQMAQLALQNAKHQEIKDLATGIITAQNKEIKEMQDWKTSWYGN